MEYKKNQILQVNIEDISADGNGIGKIDGYILFIKDALIGDIVEARITKVKKNYGYARVERIIEPSPYRVTPVCEYSRSCGGCQLQALSYDKQLSFKQQKVTNNLVRIGGFDAEYIDSIMEPIVGMEEPIRYRNKAQYPFGTDKAGRTITGFYAGRTHSIIENTECYLGVEDNKEILKIVLEYMKDAGIKPYDEETGRGIVRHVLIRKGFNTGELMVCLVINADSLPKKELLCERLAKIDGMTSISVSINKADTNVIMGDNYTTIWGQDTIKDVMYVRSAKNDFAECIDDGITYDISPLSFYQVNPVQVERLYGIAIDYAELSGSEEVWDICCGIGTISLSMASRAGFVHGVEIVPQAIEDAKHNAVNNNISNADFICAAAEEYLPEHKDSIRADVIVLDPPRKGMDERALRVIIDTAPDRIVYVSCDSATLARDLRILCDGGYELRRVRACDMFPHTVHTEAVCQLVHR